MTTIGDPPPAPDAVLATGGESAVPHRAKVAAICVPWGLLASVLGTTAYTAVASVMLAIGIGLEADHTGWFGFFVVLIWVYSLYYGLVVTTPMVIVATITMVVLARRDLTVESWNRRVRTMRRVLQVVAVLAPLLVAVVARTELEDIEASGLVYDLIPVVALVVVVWLMLLVGEKFLDVRVPGSAITTDAAAAPALPSFPPPPTP